MKKVKKIIILYPSFEKGGATFNLINFVNFCIKKKIKIYLISNIRSKEQKQFFSKNVNFINIKKKFFNKHRFSTMLYSISLLLRLFKDIKPNNSIVLSFQSHIFSILICRLLGRKIIIRNSEEIIEATKYADNRFIASFIFILKIFFYNFSNGIITNSTKAKKSLDLIIYNKELGYNKVKSFLLILNFLSYYARKKIK